MSYIFIPHFLDEELITIPTMKRRDIKKLFTRSIRVITGGPDYNGWIRTRGCFSEWWIDPIEYPELKVVYIHE